MAEAARLGDVATLRSLLEADPELANGPTEQGSSPVLLAAYHQQPEALAGLGVGAALGVFLVAFEPGWLGLHPEARLEEIVATGGALGALVGSFSGLTRL